MKHLLTFALSLALLCSLGLPSFAANGKGNEGGKAAVPYNGPKAKHPKVKTPPTPPTNPTNPTAPPVILRQPQTLNKNTTGGPTFAKPTLKSAPLTTPHLSKIKVDKSILPPGSGAALHAIVQKQNLGMPSFAQQDVPPNLNGAEAEKFKTAHGKNHNPGPFPPFHCGTQPGNNDNNDGHHGGCNPRPPHNGHGDNPGNGGHGNNPGINDGDPNAPTAPIRPGFIWVPATATVPGHWERVRAQ